MAGCLLEVGLLEYSLQAIVAGKVDERNYAGERLILWPSFSYPSLVYVITKPLEPLLKIFVLHWWGYPHIGGTTDF